MTNTTTNNAPNSPTSTKTVNKLKIMQLNTSNADWNTKNLELITLIEKYDPDVCIVSESNAETNNADKMTIRKYVFSNYKIEDKVINSQNKARVSVIIRKDVPYTRCTQLEHPENSTIVIKTKETRAKSIFIIGTYRKWRHLGGPDATSTSDINLKKQQIEQLSKLVANIKSLSPINSIIWGGDLNCDRNPRNDNMSRPDLRVVTPIFEDIINSNGLAQLNFENTRHRPGSRNSLLDVFYSDKPHRVTDVTNIENPLSEHEAVIMTFDCKSVMRTKQFITTRSYQNFTWENIQEEVETDEDLNGLFSDSNPDMIAEKLLRGINRIIKNNVSIK